MDPINIPPMLAYIPYMDPMGNFTTSQIWLLEIFASGIESLLTPNKNTCSCFCHRGHRMVFLKRSQIIAGMLCTTAGPNFGQRLLQSYHKVNKVTKNRRPLKAQKNIWFRKSPFLMGKSPIFMAIFNSYFDLTRGYHSSMSPFTKQAEFQDPSPNDRPKLVPKRWVVRPSLSLLTMLQRLSISLKVHRLLAMVPSLECHLSCK